jgi:hypothetical protein
VLQEKVSHDLSRAAGASTQLHNAVRQLLAHVLLCAGLLARTPSVTRSCCIRCSI